MSRKYGPQPKRIPKVEWRVVRSLEDLFTPRIATEKDLERGPCDRCGEPILPGQEVRSRYHMHLGCQIPMPKRPKRRYTMEQKVRHWERMRRRDT